LSAAIEQSHGLKEGAGRSLTRAGVPCAASRTTIYTLVATLTLYGALTLAMALTKRPWADEAWFAIPALNLLTRGVMATTTLETAGTWLAGLDRYTYWIMPLDIVAQAAWYGLFGFGVLAMRVLSIGWGLVAIASWYAIVRRLSERRAATLAVALIATDYLIVRGAADGRMDMMSAALGFAGIAAYLALRPRHFAAAMLAAHACVAASLLTHPNGILAFVALGALTLWFDRDRLTMRTVASAAAPYLVGFGAWGLYILQAPNLFASQFGGNATDREWTNVAASWVETLTATYSATFGLQAHWGGPLVRLRALILAAYLCGIVGLAFTPALRRHRGTCILLLIFGVYFVLLPFMRSPNAHDYLIHIVPIYLAALAIWIVWVWDHRLVPRPLIAVGFAGLLLLQIGGVIQRARTNTWANNYLPVVEFLAHETRPDDVIMGSAELGFALGFTPRLIDDARLGFRSGRHAEYIVIEDRYRSWFDDFPAKEPDTDRYVRRLLSEKYDKVYERNTYGVYRCREHRRTPVHVSGSS
jgi:4-amino-4-deoxy-L-arabinose transferase-like glycosyltransferase